VQWVLGLEDFIVDSDKAERRAFELACRLSRVEAKAARQWAALEACTDVALVCEYEQWRPEGATLRVKKEIDHRTTRKTAIGRKLPVADQISGALRVYTRSAPTIMRYA
jgi:hypothetical protein